MTYQALRAQYAGGADLPLALEHRSVFKSLGAEAYRKSIGKCPGQGNRGTGRVRMEAANKRRDLVQFGFSLVDTEPFSFSSLANSSLTKSASFACGANSR